MHESNYLVVDEVEFARVQVEINYHLDLIVEEYL